MANLYCITLALFTTGFLGHARGAAAISQVQAKDPPVLSGCEYDYAPFCIVTENQEADGFSVDLLKAALKAMGREVTFKTAAWAEIKNDLAEGRLQALPMVARSAERERAFDFTFPYLTMHGTIVVRNDNTDIQVPADLKGKRVAVLQDDIAHEYLQRAGLGAVIVPLPSFAVAMRELSAGEHDAVVIQKLLALQLIRQAGLKNLKTVGPPLTGYTQTLCLAVRKGDKDLLSVLNEGLAIVLADGTFRQLHAKWFAPLEALGWASSRILVGGDNNYPPYEFLDRNGQPAGYNVDLTRAIAKQLGLSVDIRLGKWEDMRKGLEGGEIALAQGVFYSPERDNNLRFSPPHSVVQHVIALRRGTPPVEDLQSLGGKSILVMAGDIMQDLAVQNGLEKQLVPVPTQEEALRLLAEGLHDCALVARVPALYWVQQNGWQNLVFSTHPVLSAEYCFAGPRSNEELVSIFSEGLAAIKKTGEYRAIQTRWLGPYEQAKLGFWGILRYSLLGASPIGILLAGSLLWSRSLKAQVRNRTRELEAEMAASRKAAEALRQSEERFRALAESIPNLAWWADGDGAVTWYNQRWYDYTGATPEQMQGWGWQGVHDPNLLPKVLTRWRASLATGEPFEMEFPLRGADGTYRWFLARAVPVRDPQGKVVRWFGTSTDITEAREAREVLARSKEELIRLVDERTAKLQELVGELEHFSYTITHDMRAPLRAMQGFAELMTEACSACPQQEQKAFLRRIGTSAARMDNLITDALNYSRTVRQELAVMPVDVGRLLRGMLDSYPEFQPARAQIQIEGEIPLVFGNEAGLTQCFSNLMNNAVKFVEPGQKPEIRIWAEQQSDWIRIWVEDKGIGIPESMLPRVFDMFSRGHPGYDGTGIGLALVRKVSERMGGKVGVESELGKGSRFWLELKAADVNRPK